MYCTVLYCTVLYCTVQYAGTVECDVMYVFMVPVHTVYIHTYVLSYTIYTHKYSTVIYLLYVCIYICICMHTFFTTSFSSRTFRRASVRDPMYSVEETCSRRCSCETTSIRRRWRRGVVQLINTHTHTVCVINLDISQPYHLHFNRFHW